MPGKEGQSFEMPRQRRSADLFTTQAARDDALREKVQEIPLDEIDDFPDHPFHVRQDEAMQAMVESVRKAGVLTPAVARQKEDGRYELVSGHRRKLAATLAGIDTLPVIVREMSYDEAIVLMVESNFQRTEILPSEKAFAYRMRLEAMKRQAGRPSKDNACPVGANLVGTRSDENLAEKVDDSARQIQRFIRLTHLHPDILQLVDDSKIAMRPAVEISYLLEAEQAALLEAMQSEDCTPSYAQAAKMRSYSEAGRLNADVVLSIMQEEKPNQKEQFKIPRERISGYFPAGTPSKTIEDTIIKALELWKQRQKERKRNAPER